MVGRGQPVAVRTYTCSTTPTDFAEYLGNQLGVLRPPCVPPVPNPPYLVASFDAVKEDQTVFYHATAGSNECYMRGRFEIVVRCRSA